MTVAQAVRSIRASLLLTPADPIPDGAVFVEAHFRDPEGEWQAVIPGAHLASLYNGVLSAHPQALTGRFPLPDADALRRTLDDWHVDENTPVVVYATDPHDAKTAARAWFVLRAAGIRDVRVLDGGAAGWAARGGRTAGVGAEADAVAERRSDAATGAPVDLPDVTAIDDAQAAEIARTGTLLDARPAFAYVEGHIPGAKCAPGEALFPDGYLLAPDRLQAWAERFGVTGGEPVAAYCGGGVASAGVVFALASLGIDVPMYVGSWSQWSRLPDHPVER